MRCQEAPQEALSDKRWRILHMRGQYVHTVFVYSPQKSQIEPVACEFRHIRDQGFLENVKAPKPEDLGVALAIRREWLGENHAAVRALEAGAGTPHGALPRPFLKTVEELLDARRLSVVVASPTLAQGIVPLVMS
jgi:replicative superfamily II helicase